LEKGQTLKAANNLTETHHVKIPDTTLILSTHIDYSSAYHTTKNLDPFYAVEIAASSPIYLQNLCLRY
jgi:hypothetical protein